MQKKTVIVLGFPGLVLGMFCHFACPPSIERTDGPESFRAIFLPPSLAQTCTRTLGCWAFGNKNWGYLGVAGAPLVWHTNAPCMAYKHPPIRNRPLSAIQRGLICHTTGACTPHNTPVYAVHARHLSFIRPLCSFSIASNIFGCGCTGKARLRERTSTHGLTPP